MDRNWPYNEVQQKRADRWGAHHSGYAGSLIDKRMREDKVKQQQHDLTRELSPPLAVEGTLASRCRCLRRTCNPVLGDFDFPVCQ